MGYKQKYRYHVRALTSFMLCIFYALAFVSCGDRSQPSAIKKTVRNLRVNDSAEKTRRIRLLPYWVPSAQFAGYYVGIKKGIFRKYGIALEILRFDPTMPMAQIIRDKQTDFALFWLVNAMSIRDQGVDIVNIAQFSSRSSLLLITKKSSGISTLQKMHGKRAGIWIGYELQPKALFKKFNLDVTIIPIGSTINLFLLGGFDILNANWFDEYHTVLNSGLNANELNTFFYVDFGLNFLEDGLYCLDEMTRKDPELCANFVAAILESWEYAFKYQEEAINIVVKYAKTHNQSVNLSQQRWVLKQYQELYVPAGKTSLNTELSIKDYGGIGKIMLESAAIAKIVPFFEFYKSYKTLAKSQ